MNLSFFCNIGKASYDEEYLGDMAFRSLSKAAKRVYSPSWARMMQNYPDRSLDDKTV